MYKKILIICFVIGSVAAAKAQQIDSLGTKSKTDKKYQARLDSAKAHPIVPKPKEKVYHPDSNHSPHKAVMRSLMIPGWGQIYNHQLLKVPIIYAGLGLLAWVYFYNTHYYGLYLKIAKDRENGIAPKPGASEYVLYNQYQQYGISTQAIDDAVTGYKRDQEIGIFAFVGAWGIQMIDAYIDAKFQHSYSMDSNLTLKIAPTLMTPQVYAASNNGSYIPGLKLTFTLR